jgi:hypothetical protein
LWRFSKHIWTLRTFLMLENRLVVSEIQLLRSFSEQSCKKSLFLLLHLFVGSRNLFLPILHWFFFRCEKWNIRKDPVRWQSVFRCSINKLKKRMLIHTLLRRCCLYERRDNETGSAVISELRYVKMIDRIGQALRRI